MRTAAPAGSRPLPSPEETPRRAPTLARRRATRAPILTQVEAQTEHITCLGRARNISTGGLLVETPETLAQDSSVIVRFFVPPDRMPLEAAGRVVRVEPGKSMAIAFLGLPENHKQRILDYIRRVQGESGDELAPATGTRQARHRRSARIERRLPVLLTWQDEEGRPHHEAAETQRLSQHGVQVLSFADIQAGWLVRITVPEMSKEGQSRVVWSEPSEVPGRVRLGLEFLGRDDFWGFPFPPDQLSAPPAPVPERRRSVRIPRRVEVAVNWVDERGETRKELAETQDVSQHGAQITSPVPLQVGQQIRLETQDQGQKVESRVVWTRAGEDPGLTRVGLEFTESVDFWGIPFPQLAAAV